MLLMLAVVQRRVTLNGGLQSPGLEQVFVSLPLGLDVSRVAVRYSLWKAESSILVDDRQFSDDVVVKSVEGNHESTHTRRLPDEPCLREGVLFQQTVLESADAILLLLVMPI